MNKNQNYLDTKSYLKHKISDNRSSGVLLKASSARSIQNQKRLARVKTSPGPADYNFHTIFNTKKGITIPHSQRQSELKQVKPDPWSYLPNTKSVQPRSPNTTIGRQKKFERFINAPGPADYRVNFKSIVQRSKMPVIGRARKLKQLQQKPGPSDYNTLQADRVLKREIKVSIGRESREKRSNSNSPAPNQYKIQDQFSQQTKNKMGFTMGSRIRIKTESEAPNDFLKYNSQKTVVMNKAPAFSINKQKRKYFLQSISPGPAAYSPKSNDRNQTQGITIPNSARKTYDHSEGIGVGKYYITVQNDTPGYSIPRASKTHLNLPNLPGPADYHTEFKIASKFLSSLKKK